MSSGIGELAIVVRSDGRIFVAMRDDANCCDCSVEVSRQMLDRFCAALIGLVEAMPREEGDRE